MIEAYRNIDYECASLVPTNQISINFQNYHDNLKVQATVLSESNIKVPSSLQA
jgi:hypothetical protein